jgi:7,8-dihydropterin-6-yl-methyl-4-(beta-D-ribofuranosyl)aminobenzene 5'-phosphate synthase
MKLNVRLLLAGALASAAAGAALTETAGAAESKITILYDAFGNDASMKKDWGFSALVEVAGKRILFDTGNDHDIFASNVIRLGQSLVIHTNKARSLPRRHSRCCAPRMAILI